MQTDETSAAPLIEDDPLLGAFVAHYPIDRLRLLVYGGLALAAVWFVVTVALLGVADMLAATLTVIALALATLVIAWLLSHVWNREVVLYEHGFTYREGSVAVPIRYDEVDATQQRGGDVAYFGGLVRRSNYTFTLRTRQGEMIRLTTRYRRLEDLSLRLEERITRVLLPRLERQLAEGGTLDFGPLRLSGQGVSHADALLPWSDFGGVTLRHGYLFLSHADGTTWATVITSSVENIRLLLILLRQAVNEE